MITTHNSAGGLEAQRDYSAPAIEINLIHQLMATGRPVIITGDMNEHTEFFCRVPLRPAWWQRTAAAASGGCHLPPNRSARRLDHGWRTGMSFSGYRQDAAGLGRASDHYYLYASGDRDFAVVRAVTAPRSAHERRRSRPAGASRGYPDAAPIRPERRTLEHAAPGTDEQGRRACSSRPW